MGPRVVNGPCPWTDCDHFTWHILGLYRQRQGKRALSDGVYRGRKQGSPGREQQEVVDRAKSVKEKHADRLKRFTNVVGVGVGYEIVGGKRTDRVAIRVYVRKKLPKDQLAPDAILPDTLDGLPVDVIEDEFWIHQQPPISLEERLVAHTFLRGGISLGNLLVGGAGTLGVSVFDNKTGQDMILSNWHVLCFSDTCQTGEPVIQPGAFDNGTEADLIAELVRAVLSPHVDAAIAQPLGQRPLFKEVWDIGFVEAASVAQLGAVVRKSGRSSGFTAGTISDISANVDVNGYPNGAQHFVDQIVIEGNNISIPGDSGSVWINDANEVIGLNFAGSSTRAIANHIGAVFAELDINLSPGMSVLDWHPLVANA